MYLKLEMLCWLQFQAYIFLPSFHRLQLPPATKPMKLVPTATVQTQKAVPGWRSEKHLTVIAVMATFMSISVTVLGWNFVARKGDFYFYDIYRIITMQIRNIWND